MERHRRLKILALGFLLGALTASGCGDSGPKLYPVKGRVTLKDGEPLKHGIVNFFPDASKGTSDKHLPIGYVKNGEYSMTTGSKEGVPLGFYRVTVQAAQTGGDEANPYVTEWYADNKYGSVETSGLSVEVVEKAEAGKYDFSLQPHPLHKKSGDAKKTGPSAEPKK